MAIIPTCLVCGTCCTWLRARARTCRLGFTARFFLSCSRRQDSSSGVPGFPEDDGHGLIYFGVVDFTNVHVALVFPVVLMSITGLEIPDRILQSSGRNRRGVKSQVKQEGV